MSKGTEINFEIIREPWNFYELEDDIVLKNRLVLKRVFRKKEDTGIGYSLGSQNLTVITHVPDKLKGPESERKISQVNLREHIVRDNVRFDTLREEWNEYVTEDGASIRLKLTLVNVAKTSLYDKEGDPIYIANTSTMANIRPPKTFSDYENTP